MQMRRWGVAVSCLLLVACDRSTSPGVTTPADVNSSGHAEIPAPTGRVADLVRELGSSDRQTAADAATTLGEMGRDVVAAIPALVDLATFDEPGSYGVFPGLRAADALKKIDVAMTVPRLADCLSDPSKRYWAARILGEIGQPAEPAIPQLVEALRAIRVAQTADERQASASAAAALAQIRPRGLGALVSEMGHDDPNVRRIAVWATPRGDDGIPAIDELTRCLEDDDPEVRALAAHALADIGAEAKRVLPLMADALKHEQIPLVRMNLGIAMDRLTKCPNPD